MKRGYEVLHPNQFQVNEAWIVFKLNDEAIHTEQDGDFHFLALMDAASCFILSSTAVPAKEVELCQIESRRLLKQGQAHKNQLPRTLFIPDDQPARHLTAEADRQGITVVRVAEDQLMIFIGEAREGFGERFGGGGALNNTGSDSQRRCAFTRGTAWVLGVTSVRSTC